MQIHNIILGIGVVYYVDENDVTKSRGKKYLYIERTAMWYDGASVNSRKKNSNIFLHRFFTKTAEKKNSAVFGKRWRKKI